ncbi:hypothetical protein P1X14_05100 [Sphingomonas sp. AOB5]|uniref:surface-adhesin E family protein n=1 Tax=Sphingomonas sp. AOB5 TaxID=3034017 RepID=UPI0023F7BCAB|nr:surface-adhesin E family protein [Sphingomonas sp. AOB5]MDF7774615.1 hypothetical protein [Sphingomonas sp. AOB5]
MTRIARYFLVAITLGWAGCASAQSWRVASIAGQSPDRTAYVIDASTVVLRGDIIEFRTQSIYETMGDVRDFNLSEIRRRGNCRTMQHQILSDNYYANGTLLSSNDNPGQMLTANEGSAIWGVLLTACGKRDYATQPIANPFDTLTAYFRNNR